MHGVGHSSVSDVGNVRRIRGTETPGLTKTTGLEPKGLERGLTKTAGLEPKGLELGLTKTAGQLLQTK